MSNSLLHSRKQPVVPYEQRITVTRRELARMLDQWRRDAEAQNNPLANLSPRRRAILESAATARVLRHPRPWMEPSALLPFWSGPGDPPTESQMRGIVRKVKMLIPTVGGLDQDLAPWTPGFWSGLRMSGALVKHGGYPRIQAQRPWLEEDIERITFCGRLAKPDRQGRRWLLGCEAWRLPVANRLGADVLAGLLAGGKRRELADGTWLVVPHTECVRRLLDFWKIPVVRDQGHLLVSPFWGVILSGHLPPACASSMMVRRAGGCPLIPAILYNLLWGPSPRHGYLMPIHAGELPYLCSHATRIRRGWTRDYLRRTAAITGMIYLPVEMRTLLKEWRTRNRTADARNASKQQLTASLWADPVSEAASSAG